MSEEQGTSIKDRFLEAEVDNRKAITALMQRYDIDEATAKELWEKFIERVKELKSVAEEKKDLTGAGA